MTKNSNGNYTPSSSWCRGCEKYTWDNRCNNESAVKYGYRLGNSKDTVPCWLIRGTVYCKRDENGAIK